MVDAGSSKRLLGLPLLVVVVAAAAAEGHSVGTGQHWLRSVHRVGESRSSRLVLGIGAVGDEVTRLTAVEAGSHVAVVVGDLARIIL